MAWVISTSSSVASAELAASGLRAAPDWARPPFLRGLCDQVVRREGRVVSGKVLGEREGAMAGWRNQVVLPVGRMQDRVDAGVGGARVDRQCHTGEVAVH